MIFSNIVGILCILGVYGFFSEFTFFLILGALANIIEQIIEYRKGNQTNFGTLAFAILFGLGMFAGGVPIIKALSFTICIEGSFMFLLSIIPFIATLFTNKNEHK